MLNNNFWRVLQQNFIGKVVTGSIKTPNGANAQINNAAGTFVPYFNDGSYAVQLSTVLKNYGKQGVVFGDGDTPPTLGDYKLSGNIITALSAVANVARSIEGGVAKAVAVYMLMNNSNEDVTIREMGAIACYNTSSGYLVDRNVLNTTVTIPAGGVGQVESTITFQLPTATA